MSPWDTACNPRKMQGLVVECYGEGKMCWVVGPAGVGKSAIMQIVAEETPADAAVFFSAPGRQDAAKTFTTVAYQFAAKYDPYRQFLRDEISRDPSLLCKALPVQFQKFIVEPFIHRYLFHSPRRFLIIIDGLDECDNPTTQQELLRLISEFCIAYPSSPIAWFIASRPEPHLTAFFDDGAVAPVYTKEEIMIDSDEACQDVQRYLRSELSKTKSAYTTLKRKQGWPSELEFAKIASAASGLYAYASAVVRYINNPHYRDPVALLRHVLDAIDSRPRDGVSGKDHPMAQLDALYARILSNIPFDGMNNAKKLLLICSKCVWGEESFRSLCNRLELTEDAAYGAVSHLHAVVRVPAPEDADDEGLEYFHKSFADFLFDFRRSRFCQSITDEVEQLQAQSSLRIVQQVPDNFSGMASDGIGCPDYGSLKGGPGFCDSISLSWPDDTGFLTTDRELRLNLYCASMGEMCYKFKFHNKFYRTISFFRLLTSRFIAPGLGFPFYELRASAFRNFRAKLTELGKLKQVPLRNLDYAAICGRIDFRYTRPSGVDGVCSDPWNPSCEHQKYIKEDVDGSQLLRGWATTFERFLNGPGDPAACADIPWFSAKGGKHFHWDSVDRGGFYECLYCSRRFAHHFIDNPDQLATVFVDSTDMCYVELSFVDPGDGVSKWRYRFFHSGSPSLVSSNG